jgi:hypothetical protein
VKDQTGLQLEVLREIDLIFSRLQIDYWLRGGCAIDFLTGQITRPHADLDLVTWQRYRRQIQQTLVAAGFEFTRELNVQIDFVKNGQDVTFMFLEHGADSVIHAHGLPEWTWPPDSLPSAEHCLKGLCARVVSPTHMLRDIEGYEAATGRGLRPKDIDTIVALRRIILKQSAC